MTEAELLEMLRSGWTEESSLIERKLSDDNVSDARADVRGQDDPGDRGPCEYPQAALFEIHRRRPSDHRVTFRAHI
jgi:hypothetical protein